MTETSTVSVLAPPYVDSFIRYSDRTAEGGVIRGNGDFSFGMEDHPTRVHNARLIKPDFKVRGFTLLRHATDIDFENQDEVQRRWYPEASRLVRELTGAREAFAFLGILRGGDKAEGGGPALSAHVDFNEAALRGWVQRIAPDRAEALAHKRLVNINLWRPLRPVENMPLAVCDASSVERRDFMTVRFMNAQTGSVSDTEGGLNKGYNPNHRWFYYPDMQPDEVLAFKLYDTADSDWRMSAHTAFVDPTSRPESPKRISYEVRTIAVFD